MQKKIIALAVAGLASTAAFAQSNVTVYGRIDLGGVYQGGNSGAVTDTKTKYQMASGIEGGSRLGFKGVEDLGNGLKALFEVEYGISIDEQAGSTRVNNASGTQIGVTSGGTSNATLTNRHSYVGLTGGFGTAVAGRLDGVRYGIFTQYDPFGAGSIANFTQMTLQVDRADNAVAYISPNFYGFGAVLAYATNIGGAENGRYAGFLPSVHGNNGDVSLETIMLTYDNGPISARLDYEQTPTPGTIGNRTYVMTAAGSYDFGVVKVSALLDQIRNSTLGLKQDAWMVGAKAPVGKFVGKAMVGGVLDQSNGVTSGDSVKWGLGVDYLLSKRTNLYLNYGQIHNQSNAARTISWAPNANNASGAGTGTAGYGTAGVDFGIAHTF